jgi:hypothetical protein
VKVLRRIDAITLTVKFGGRVYGPRTEPERDVLRRYVSRGCTRVWVQDDDDGSGLYFTATLWDQDDRYKWVMRVTGPEIAPLGGTPSGPAGGDLDLME